MGSGGVIVGSHAGFSTAFHIAEPEGEIGTALAITSPGWTTAYTTRTASCKLFRYVCRIQNVTNHSP
jgi:hypothetical protein